MPIPLPDVDLLQKYLVKVMERADHHARGVDQIALALVGAVVWKKTGTLEVMPTKDGTGNVLWFHVGKARYALSYNHDEGSIDLREKTTQGERLAALDNDTSLDELRKLFNGL